MIDLFDMSYQGLAEYLENRGEKSFRAAQIFERVYQKGARSFDEINVLPAALRKTMARDYSWTWPVIADQSVSTDGTIKFVLKLRDGENIETVLIPAAARATVCVSTQVGCKYGCRFCASGVGGRVRNLSCHEIIQQVLCAKSYNGGRPVTHIVFMGMGEPLDNYEQVLKAVRILNDSHGLNIGARRITLSTCGIIPQMRRLSGEGLQFELAVSLHGFDESSRGMLMPINKKYPLSELIKTCREYVRVTKRQITFEYILIKDVTCSVQAGRKLGKLLKGLLCKINLIVYNEVAEFDLKKPSHQEIQAFRKQLDLCGIHQTLRRPRGQDVAAACGQLRNKISCRDIA